MSDIQKKLGLGQQQQIPEVDGSVVCHVAIAAFLWGTNGGEEGDFVDTRSPRAALDLLSAWTASDLDALDAASDACFAPTTSDSSSSGQSSHTQKKKASQHFLTPEDIRRMKPRQVSTHRKREGEFTRSNLSRAIKHISTFCNEQSGGLNSMLICASTTNDHRLRREVGLQIGRMMSVYVENDDVKKLIYRELGCSDCGLLGRMKRRRRRIMVSRKCRHLPLKNWMTKMKKRARRWMVLRLARSQSY